MRTTLISIAVSFLTIFGISCSDASIITTEAEVPVNLVDNVNNGAPAGDNIPTDLDPNDLTNIDKDVPVPEPGPVDPSNRDPKLLQLVEYGCDSQNLGFKASREGIKGDSVQVEGQICINKEHFKETEIEIVPNPLTVLFVIDTSGSMRQDPYNSKTNSCNRKTAIEAIVNKIKVDPNFDASLVKFGLVTFNYSATASTVAGQKLFNADELENLNDMKSPSTRTGVCFQSGGTSYSSALASTKNVLKDTTGQKIVYFLTDGAPEENGNGLNYGNTSYFTVTKDYFRPEVKALQHDGVSFNGVYLGSNATAINFLKIMVMNEDRFAQASKAADLVEAFESFHEELITTYVDYTKAFSGVVGTVNGTKLDFERVVLDGNKIDFTTKAFVLKGAEGLSLSNDVSISASFTNGRSYSASTDVEFTVIGN